MTMDAHRPRARDFATALTVLGAVANQDRLAILDVLRQSAREPVTGLSITHIAASTGLSRFSASRHLGILAEAGVVDVIRDGLARLHRLRPEAFGPLEDWLYPILDADEHEGLAPIVIVADQLGGRGGDPACADSAARGDAKTYITDDVVAWARTHLNVIDDPAYWTIGGYSNGASCAVKYAALHPDIWSNTVAVSPEEYPGVNYSGEVITQVYGGDRARWEADKPIVVLQSQRGAFADSWAVVTTGALDDSFGPGSRALAAAMDEAGIRTTVKVIPGVSHVGDNVPRSQETAYPLLFAQLGLASPPEQGSAAQLACARGGLRL